MSSPPWIQKKSGEILHAKDWNDLQSTARDEIHALSTVCKKLTATIEQQAKRIDELESALKRVAAGASRLAEIRAEKDADPQWFINKNSHEIHQRDCPSGKRVALKNRYPKEGFLSLNELKDLIAAKNLDGCRICMPELHTL